MKRLPVFVSFVFFIALCISATYWTIQLFNKKPRAIIAPPLARVEVNLISAAAIFGGRPLSAAVASNFQLKGVVVAVPAEESVAILASDGKPAQAYAINMEVMPGVTVKEVHPKYVLLSEGNVTKRVELPESGQQMKLEMGSNDASQNQTVQSVNTPMTNLPMSTSDSTLPMPLPQRNPNQRFMPPGMQGR